MHAIAVLPEGLENEGAKELLALGAKSVKPLKRAASFEADMACFYRINLLARIPFRLLREVAVFPCDGPKMLYSEIEKVFNWQAWLPPSMSFKVDVTGSSAGLTHSHYTALQVKNSLVDLQRKLWGERSKIDLKNPDLCLHLHVKREHAVLSLDSSARSLHKRGYRSAVGDAPLKENLAAGLIQLSGWNKKFSMVDPMCGSGTFLIEAANMAFNIAPGLGKKFLIESWADFEKNLWEEEEEKARKTQKPIDASIKLIGCERDQKISKQAKENIVAAGLEEAIDIKTSDFRKLELPAKSGLIICNPPYGKRLGKDENLSEIYSNLGSFAKNHASGWQLWVLSGNRNLSKFLKLKASKRFPINNGGIDCRWIHYAIN